MGRAVLGKEKMLQEMVTLTPISKKTYGKTFHRVLEQKSKVNALEL
jgi:hypothetical protein